MNVVKRVKKLNFEKNLAILMFLEYAKRTCDPNLRQIGQEMSYWVSFCEGKFTLHPVTDKYYTPVEN